ncbi:P12 family lipoprotein (plasmid) [Borrelia parkeri]|uniref:P12 family lipoprotein n=1 Tax=Borrelia parkeri TaxID=141 RepID=UPI001FF548F1|nr:P12 family lipoprotein [Borrelia parkeri]UPA11498.1 P12 family lipoprotein [Borrelia parkeri]UPA11549.1 P12 family lipoprotein [Borrelia parkeri]UPA11655.1 P12 family lipoprotein [Borrelia parkeri]
MKRSILSVCILTLLCLLSCDINALNDLLNEVREKFLDESKDNKGLNHKQENQEQKEVVIDAFEEGVEIKQDMGVKPVNAGFEVSEQFYPYYVQEEIEIKEGDLIPSTESEKEVDNAVKNIERVIEDSGFSQLIEDALKLKSEYERLESSFYGILSELKNKIRSSNLIKDKTNRQKLIKLQNRFNEERNQLDMFMTQIDAGLNKRSSAKYFFEEAQKTLREAIIERLRNNKRRSYSSRRWNSDSLAQKARSDAENVLSLLESSSSNIGEAIGIKKEIEELINEAKSVLENLSR